MWNLSNVKIKKGFWGTIFSLFKIGIKPDKRRV